MDGSEGFTSTVRAPLMTEILQRWQEIAPLLKHATDRSEGCYEPEDILGLLFGGRATMLLVERGSTLVVVAVVELRNYPRRRVLDVGFIGGKLGETNLKEWVPVFVEHLENMARACGATMLSGCGRIG